VCEVGLGGGLCKIGEHDWYSKCKPEGYGVTASRYHNMLMFEHLWLTHCTSHSTL
jgi:hypothetical protein